MNQCINSSFPDLTITDFIYSSIFIGVLVLISICIFLIVKFISKFIFYKIKWLCSKKYRHYLFIVKTRKDYTNKQFIQDCEALGIDPFVAKVFWNFCYRYYPYKPQLEDSIDVLGKIQLQSVIINTMEISYYNADFDYSKAQNIKDVLLLLSP